MQMKTTKILNISKRDLRLVISIWVIFLILIPFLLKALATVRDNPVNGFVFSDIEQFEKLEPYVTGEALDLRVGSLRVKESYCKTVSYNGENFNVFAYVFEDTVSAQLYAKRCTGNTWNRPWAYALISRVFSPTKYVAFYRGQLYYVEGGSYQTMSSFVNWLSSDFPTDVLKLLLTVDVATWDDSLS